VMSSAYHPQSDGQSEVLNTCVEMHLKYLTSQNPKNWSKVLAWTEYWNNTTFHISLGMTPFKAIYGRDPSTLTRYNADDSNPSLIKEL